MSAVTPKLAQNYPLSARAYLNQSRDCKSFEESTPQLPIYHDSLVITKGLATSFIARFFGVRRGLACRTFCEGDRTPHMGEDVAT